MVLIYRDLVLIHGALTRSYNELERHHGHGSKELGRAMVNELRDLGGLIKAIKSELATRDAENDHDKEKIK